ncbi:MAG: glycosyltransferase [Gemmatimonadaceae bacterium]
MTSVSVVIPCYNHGRYLAEAIESVLAQSREAEEIIVVDDGSTDDTRAVAARYESVTCVSQANQGLAAARNAGARASTAQFLVFLDADDRLCPTAIESGLRCHEENPGCGLVYGSGVMFDDSGLNPIPEEPAPGPDPYERLLKSNYLWAPHMAMYRRESFEAVGGFTSGIDAAADYALNLGIVRQYPVARHSDLVAEYRFLADSMSRDYPMMLASVRRVMDGEWRFVEGNTRLERAWRIGKRNWALTFTKLMIAQTVSSLRNGGPWKPVGRNCAALIRYGPPVGMRTAVRRLKAPKSGKPAPSH